MATIFDYDHDYDGPALPVVDVTVFRSGDQQHGIDLEGAIVDSGADASMFPARVLTKLSARKVDWMRSRGVHGPSYIVNIYEVDVLIGEFRISRLYVAADPANQNSIIGRDLLNQLVVTLDGPDGFLTIAT